MPGPFSHLSLTLFSKRLKARSGPCGCPTPSHCVPNRTRILSLLPQKTRPFQLPPSAVALVLCQPPASESSWTPFSPLCSVSVFSLRIFKNFFIGKIYSNTFSFFKNDCIGLFLDTGGGREKEKERNIIYI